MSDEISPPPKQTGKDPNTELKSAAQLYWLYAFCLALPMAIVLALSQKKPDSVAITIFSCFGIYLLLLIIAGILLFKKKKYGLYLGWILTPLILLSFPIGTVFGIFIITKIVKKEVRALLTSKKFCQYHICSTVSIP